MTPFKIAVLAGGAICAIVLLLLSSQIFEVNHAGYVQVKQSAIDGTMEVRMAPGTYPQMFGTITTYKNADLYDFNGGTDQISVRFNDAATAHIGGQIMYRLPITEAGILKIQNDFRSEATMRDMLRQVVAASLKQAATFFRAEEVYSTRRSEFITLVTEQIRNGIYATNYSEVFKRDEDGNNNLVKAVSLKLDKEGKPIVEEKSAFDLYSVELVQLALNNIEFDEQTQALIAKRKDAEQQRVVAKANAERAKQDTITAQEQGKAQIALAEATALVEKKTAVVAAERETEVSTQKALQAEQEKRKIIALGEADAAATKLKVAAGLSPLEQAEIQMKTQIEVAKALSNITLPQLMVMGGSDKGGAVNPFDAVGLESFMRMSRSMSEK